MKQSAKLNSRDSKDAESLEPFHSNLVMEKNGLLVVREVTDRSEWDQFVNLHAEASPYHLWEWAEAIARSYGHKVRRLGAYQDNKIRAVLPLVEMRSFLFGSFLTSMPFVNYGGILAENKEAFQALKIEAEGLAKEIGVDHLELRQGAAVAFEGPSASAKVAMIVDLPGTTDELMAGLGSRLRNKVRNSQKQGFTIVWGGAECLADFYTVFAINMRELGTPVYSFDWFRNVMDLNRESLRILILKDKDVPVAATVLLSFRNKIELPWIASVPESRKGQSTILLYWTALAWAVENGFASVDLGRCSPGGGTYQFKRQWNPREVPLHWYYWIRPGGKVPELRPSNPKYRMAIAAWQRLPLAVANWLGPKIVKYIP